MTKANERTFQGILFNVINLICSENQNIIFNKITQEEQIGSKGVSKFADGLLYNNINDDKILFELKNLAWDATEESLVIHAHEKASLNGYEYFVTGTPKQLVLYRTFEAGKPLIERKLKIFNISRIKSIDYILSTNYEKEIQNSVKAFLLELSEILLGNKKAIWTSIDEFFVNKLSNFIFSASEDMYSYMYERVSTEKKFQSEIKKYLHNQDIFNITINFNSNDIYNLCQLANYLLFLKIIFYSYLQREVPSLNLKKLEIPLDNELLNITLRKRFDDVLKHDFELIFESNILDEFMFSSEYLSEFKANIKEIEHLNFKEINADIIGSIYNTLIDNQEQHDRGQHFTNTNEVDIICSFCIDKTTHFIMDSGCGAGTFLVRAYKYLNYFHSNYSHQELLERLWGIDIAPFPVFLAMMNLCLLEISSDENYPIILQKDFADVESSSRYKIINLNKTKELDVRKLDKKYKSVKIPIFDACIGNPPYIRQELVHNKDKWTDIVSREFNILKINKQSDLFVYYLIHTSAFLREGGKLGYVIASSWLDVSYGAGLQKFLLDNYKIIAIIDNQKIRSFETASVNTVILILEKCSNTEIRDNHKVKFIRVYKDYRNDFGTINDEDRLEKVYRFTDKINSITDDYKDDELMVTFKYQHELIAESTFKGKYENGHWGAKYLRAPEIYKKMISYGNGRFIKLTSICDISRGITSGANEFFYLKDHTDKLMAMTDQETELMIGHKINDKQAFFEKYGYYYSDLMKCHYVLEKQFLFPLFKTQKEAKNLEVDISKLKYCVFICNESKKKLKAFKYKVLKYILDAEAHEGAPHLRPSCSARISVENNTDWYMLGKNIPVADFIFPSKIGEKFRLIDNRISQVYVDKVNYNITVKNEYKQYSDIIFTYLNSFSFRYFIDLFSRQLTGNQTLSDVDVNLVEKTLIINPELFIDYKEDFNKIYESIKTREQESIFDETQKQDKIELDSLIFKSIGLDSDDVKELYKQACLYINERAEKSSSMVTTKTKGKMGYSDALNYISDKFENISRYNDLIEDTDCKTYKSYNLKMILPKNLNQNISSIFDSSICIKFIKDDKTSIIQEFDNKEQVLLFEFLVKEIGIKDIDISIPISAKSAYAILSILKKDYNENLIQIKNLLRTQRINFSEKQIYKDILLSPKEI